MRCGIISIFLAVIFVASCAKIDISSHEPKALNIDVSTASETKTLVTGRKLPSGTSIGLFVSDVSDLTYDGVSVSNVKYTSTGEGDSQIWNTASDIMLSGTKGTLKGYYPYDESVTDITAIPVEATNDNQTDWMWATPVSNLCNKSYNATVKMNHALAVVRLNIRRKSYNGTGEVTSVSFNSESAAAHAILNATNGALTSIRSTDYSYMSSNYFLLTEESKTVEFITIPSGVKSPINISVTVDGTQLNGNTDEVKIEAGNLYEYSVFINKNELNINTIEITDWNNKNVNSSF